MPTYQYVCTNPDEPHQFERVQTFSEAAVSVCPVCGAPVRKRYGSVGVVFKGSGFYRNDSRGGTSSSDAPKTDAKADAKSDGAKSDAKSESKSDSSNSDSGSSTKSAAAASSPKTGASTSSAGSSGSSSSS
ncbi:MAG: regulatory protein FmdB family, partial [Jatrophihabitantaceae bacterium]|nr:regulatory protein FmdB family [Jatrophihabitantaceae bacterium]